VAAFTSTLTPSSDGIERAPRGGMGISLEGPRSRNVPAHHLRWPKRLLERIVNADEVRP
jgi:hypothetical protein